MVWNSFLNWRELKMTNQPVTEVDLLKKQLAEETKEKYALYKRIKELNEEIKHLRNDSNPISGPEYRQRYHT